MFNNPRILFGNSRPVGSGLFRLFRRLNGKTAPGMLLQYPTPRLPRTSISRIVSLVASSCTIRASRYSSRFASSGLRPPPAPAAFGITDAAQTEFVQSRFTPHPFNTFVSPLKLANKVGNGLPATYIVCADPIYKPLEASRTWVKAAGWKTVEIKCGHDAMVIAPDRLADLLDADAA
jgi:hypothetical protein